MKERLVVVGPVPPPYHGVTVSTSLLLSSELLRERFAIEHLDTSDHRTALDTIGRWDLENVLGGLRGAVRLLARLRGQRGVVYLPLSQNVSGFLRDSLFIHIGALRGWKVCVHLRGSDFRDLYRSEPWPIRIWMWLTLRRVTSMGVMGTSLRRVFEGLLPGERIAVVPNGTPEIAMPDVPRNPSQVLFFSNFLRRKGVAEAVEAALHVLQEWPTARFVFAGDWEDSELERTLRTRAEEADGRLEFRAVATGDDRLELLASSGMLLFPPVEPEGHPRVVLEALAAGLPVITTNRGAIAETVVDGESGFVLENPVPRQLAERVLRLLRDSGLRDRMSQGARSRYLERFTQDAADLRFAEWIGGMASR